MKVPFLFVRCIRLFSGIGITGLEVIKLEFILKLKIKHTDWLHADTRPQAANHCALFGNVSEMRE